MEKDIHDIRSWLEQRPEVQKAVILEGLDWCPDSCEFEFHALNVFKRLHGASLPPDFDRWCLEQAVVKENTNPRVADYLFKRAFYWTGNEDPALEILRERAQKNERWKASLEELLASRTRMEEQDVEHRERTRTFTGERQQEEENWLAHVRLNEAALRENRAAPSLLFQLAKVYFGINSTSRGSEAVREALRGDQHLPQAVLQGFRGTVNRQDVPTLEEILSVQGQGRMHYLALPLLAGLAETERTTLEDAAQWDDDQIRKAIALYYGYGAPLSGDRPSWYQRLLVTRPELVAEVQVQIAISEFRSGREHIGQLWELARDSDHAKVAKYASLPLLRAFPTRCKLVQLRSLDHMLWAAIQHADEASLQELIKRKRALASMNVAQRGHWLAAGFILAPGTYDNPMNDYLRGQENRIRRVAEFFGSQGRVRIELEIPLSKRLIRLVGSCAGPEPSWVVGGMIRSEMASSDFVNALIQRLAGSPTKAASDALASLLADSELLRWRDALSHAQGAQRMIRRDASYRHPTIEQVYQTLKGGTPANPGDLAGLVMDRLSTIADQIRANNANYWRPYWNEDKYQKPTNPKHENSCRDALVLGLRQHFPKSDPEVQYVNGKRADIRVTYRDFQVPVEIKKNSHSDLWSALRNQLIAQYTSDPETDGYGIYLVFWFGKKYTQPSPSGKHPVNAEELKERLEKTLSADERRKISVCVIDVSKP